MSFFHPQVEQSWIDFEYHINNKIHIKPYLEICYGFNDTNHVT